METQDRMEHRFFFSQRDRKIIVNRLLTHPKLTLSRFVYPVTETVYFLFEKTHEFPDDFYVRMRRYVDSESKQIFIYRRSLFSLEIKTKDKGGTSKVMKIRTSINGRLAIKILAHPEKNDILSELPVLFPGIATQARRIHFVHSDCDLRVTLDQNISFFGFSGKNYFHGYQMGLLKEGKIEFKNAGAGEIIDLNMFEDEILKDCRYHQESSLYLERKVLRCYSQWLKKQLPQSR